jgi:hypothetical protein
MCVTRVVPACFAGIMSVLGAAQAAGAKEEIMLRAGAAAGPNAVLAIDNGAKPQQIIVRTTQAGVAGSRIEVTVDMRRRLHLTIFLQRRNASSTTVAANARSSFQHLTLLMQRFSLSSSAAGWATLSWRTRGS